MLRLRRVLEAKGMTIKSCAALLGIAEKTLYNKMSGSTDFMYNEIKKLATILPEYNIDYLLSEDIAIEQSDRTGKAS